MDPIRHRKQPPPPNWLGGFTHWLRWPFGTNENNLPLRQIGPYHLLELLRQSDCCHTYLAEAGDPPQPAVVKVLNAKPSSLNRERFEREGRVLGQLCNPHTVRLLQVGKSRRWHYLAMEGVSGLTLDQLSRRCNGYVSDGRTILLLHQICSSLAELHANGLIHRDIKPANIMVSLRGGEPDWLTVLDFGLAEAIRPPGTNTTEAERSQPAAISGTPAYLSPEAATLASPLDSRSDIYSLGCVAYFLLAGRPPFHSQNPIELCWLHAEHAPPPLASVTSVPVASALAELVMQCLEKAPSQRPQSAQELAETLTHIQPLHPWTNSDANQWWKEQNLNRL